MSLPNCSHDHTAVLPSVYNACQHPFRSSASFPAQIEFCRLLLRGQSRHTVGARAGAKVFPSSQRPAWALLFARLLPFYWFTCFLIFLLTFQVFFFARRRTVFIYEYVNFRGGTRTLKWTCKEPIEKQVPAALIMRTDKAVLLGLFMTFCLC